MPSTKIFLVAVFLSPLIYASPVLAQRMITIVSVPPQGFLANRIAGELSDVEVILPPSANPHTFEPSIKQLRAINNAQVFIQVGHPKLPFELQLLAKLKGGKKRFEVIDMAQGVIIDEDDPHLWLSINAMRKTAVAYADFLTAKYPAEKENIKIRLQILLNEINATDQFLKDLFAPKTGSKFLVMHPAWGYFAADYNLIQLSIEHHGKEPGAHSLNRVINDAKQLGIKTIFVQPQFSRRSAEMIAKDIGAEIRILDSLPENWLEGLRNSGLEIEKALAK